MPSNRKLDRYIFETRTLVAAARDLVYEVGLDTTPLDRDVVIDQLDASHDHLVDAYLTLHPCVGAEELERAFPERCECAVRRGVDVMTLLDAAFMRALDAAHVASRTVPKRVGREAAEALDCAASHLETAAYVVDPARFRPPRGATRTERVQIASRIEWLELAVQEARKIALVCAHPFGLTRPDGS